MCLCCFPLFPYYFSFSSLRPFLRYFLYSPFSIFSFHCPSHSFLLSFYYLQNSLQLYVACYLYVFESPTIDLYLKQTNEGRRIEKEQFQKVRVLHSSRTPCVSFMVGNEGQDTRLLANAQVLNVNAQPSDSVLKGKPLTKRVCPCVCLSTLLFIRL